MNEDTFEQRQERFREAAAEFTTNTFEELSEKARSEEVEVRALAVVRLMNLEDPRAVPILMQLMDDPAVKIRAMAALGIGHYEPPQAREVLIEHLRNDDSLEVRAMCVRSLAYIGGADAEIIRALDDPHWAVRQAAIDELSALGKSEAADRIAALLDDPDWNVRYSACLALMNFGISNAKVIETLNGFRDIPEAMESIDSFAFYDAVLGIRPDIEEEMDVLVFEDDIPSEEAMDMRREKYGEEAVPRPSPDPLCDLIARATEMCR